MEQKRSRQVQRLNVALYTRVSTPDQNPYLRIRELTEYADRQGWTIVPTYQDVISGAKASRPGLDQIKADLSALPSRKFDAVLVWKLDRFGRSVTDCLTNIELLETHGVRLIATSQGIDTGSKNPWARFMSVMLSAAAEFDWSLIVERNRAGQARYRQDYEVGKEGKTVHSRSGKNQPPPRPVRVFDRHRVFQLREGGMSLREIAKDLGISLGTVTRTFREQ